jgi:hypothetical protein
MPTFLVQRYPQGATRAWLETALARLTCCAPDVVELGSFLVP